MITMNILGSFGVWIISDVFQMIFAVLLMASDFREIIGDVSDDDYDIQDKQMNDRDPKEIQKQLEISKTKKEQRG